MKNRDQKEIEKSDTKIFCKDKSPNISESCFVMFMSCYVFKTYIIFIWNLVPEFQSIKILKRQITENQELTVQRKCHTRPVKYNLYSGVNNSRFLL